MFTFIDLDGVLADFVGGVCLAHGKQLPYPEDRGVWDMAKIWGISLEEFWTPTNSFDFWYNLLPTPEAEMIVQTVESFVPKKNIAILTSPSLDKECIPAKRKWVMKYFPQFSGQIIFTNAKKFLSGPGRLLIDDDDKNIEAFHSGGGMTVKVPRLWNSEWEDASICAQIVEHRLREIAKYGK